MLTKFQTEYITKLTKRHDFSHMCYDYVNCPFEGESESTRNFLFITESNNVKTLHGHRVGRKRLVGTVQHTIGA